MERESSFKDPLKPMPMKFDASHKPKDEPNQKMTMEAGTSEYPFARPWMAAQTSMPAPSYVNFLAESSAFLPLSSYEDMLERISSSVGGVHDGELSEMQRDFLYGSSKASGSKSSIGFSMDMDSWKARRIRIAERLVALEELLPHPVEGKVHHSSLLLGSSSVIFALHYCKAWRTLPNPVQFLITT